MAITYKTGLTDVQKQGIESLVSSGRTFNETDAKNYAYATGAGDYNQFLGKTGSQITIPASVSADSMTTGSTFKTVPGVNPADPTPYVQSLADATSQAQKDFQALQKSSAESSGVNTLTTERTGLTGRLQDALSKLTGKGTALQTAEADLGVPQDLSRLKELNLQMTNLTNEYNKRIASIPGQGIGLTNQAVGQLTDREKRMAAVEIGGLAAVQSALQGNIALSQQQADRTVQMQFEPIEQEIKNLQIQLDLNYDNLSRAEKKQADELSFVLQERQAQVDQAKEDRLSIINMASEAAQQGADTVTLNKILKAGTIEDALAIAGDSLGAGFRAQQEQQNFENALAMGKLISTKSGPNSPSPSGPRGPIDPSKLSPLAQQVYSNPAILDNLTPTEKGKILKELSSAGLDLNKFAVENVGAAQREQIAQYDDLIRQAGEAQVILEETGLNTGPIASKYNAAKALVGGAKEFTQYRSVIDNMGSTLIKMRSGAAVTPQEFERIRGFIPGINDDEKTAKTKIIKFNEEIAKAQANFVTRATQTENQIIDSVSKTSADPLNLNKSSDPLGILK